MRFGDGFDADLFDAVEFGDFDYINILFGEDIDINIQDLSGRTLLMLASMYGFVDIAEFLLEHDADPNLKDKKGETAMMKALKNSHRNIVELLKNYSVGEENGLG